MTFRQNAMLPLSMAKGISQLEVDFMTTFQNTKGGDLENEKAVVKNAACRHASLPAYNRNTNDNIRFQSCSLRKVAKIVLNTCCHSFSCAKLT